MAWSLAANCLLYEEDPGPAEVNVASDAEPRMVPRREAWRDYYARYLLNELDADLARVGAVADEYGAELIRLASDRDLQEGLPALRECALDLAERADRVVRTVGADVDDKARQRLLAGTDQWLTVQTLGGFFPGIDRDSARTLIERLDDIDCG